jgi:hypothetical protein
MQIAQVPCDRRVLAIDLERVFSVVAARVAGRFKGRERAVAEAREKRRRVVRQVNGHASPAVLGPANHDAQSWQPRMGRTLKSGSRL